MARIETALIRTLGITHPILLAPTGSAAGGKLAAAVTNAGGWRAAPRWFAPDDAAADQRLGSVNPWLRSFFSKVAIPAA